MDELPNVPTSFQPKSPAEDIKVENIEPLGELLVGGGSANAQFLLTALSILNDPNLNHFFLSNKLKLSDRFTKTVIFPHDGMALPDGEVYKSPEPVEIKEENNGTDSAS